MDNDKNEMIAKFFRGELSSLEVRELLNLLNQPTSLDSWLVEEWEQAEEKIKPEIDDKLYLKVDKNMCGRKVVIGNWWLQVAVIFVIFGLGLLSSRLINNFKDEDKMLVVETANGQKSHVILPDGTCVLLNSASKLSYAVDFDIKHRDVLLEGEAWFEVNKNGKIPFIVKNGDFMVKALGTEFNVRAYADEKQKRAVLVKGKIEIVVNDNKIMLSPNQQVVYSIENGSFEKNDIHNTDLHLAWKENKLSFEDETMENITKILSRNYNIEFEFLDESLKEIPFSGTLPDLGLISLMEIFTLTAPVSYHISNSKIILTEDKRTKEYFEKFTTIK